MHMDIHAESQGRWRGILSQFGLGQKELSGKGGPCPFCGGKDRFRFTDLNGRGTWICNQCAPAGDRKTGIDMVMMLRGWDFLQAAQEVRAVLGGVSVDPAKAGMSDEEKRRLRRELWQASVPVTKGDPVDAYLRNRKVDQGVYPLSLRFCPSARYAEGQHYPAMIAAIQDPSGRGVSLHRTFLQDGAKAPVESPRMMMPGDIPKGSAVRLGEPGEVLGIAEGIETAMAACERFHMPVWAALNASLLAEWQPPAGVSEVVAYADHDASGAGHLAAYRLKGRLHREGIKCQVVAPDREGTDWADIHAKEMGCNL